MGYLEEYPQYPHEMEAFADEVVPRGGNAGGGGQPGWILKCKGWETDPNAYIYFTIQGHAWAPICDALGKPEWKTDPAYNTPKARQPHIMDIFATIEDCHQGQDQVRGGGHPPQVRHPLRAGAVDEGTAARQVACAPAAPSSKCRTRCAAATAPWAARSSSRTSSPRSPARRCWASTPTRCWPNWATAGADRGHARGQGGLTSERLRVPATTERRPPRAPFSFGRNLMSAQIDLAALVARSAMPDGQRRRRQPSCCGTRLPSACSAGPRPRRWASAWT